MQLAAAVALMPLLIFCCVHRSSDSQCFSVVRTIPKLPLPQSGPQSNDGSLGVGPTRVTNPNIIAISLAVSAQLTNVTKRHTDRPPRYCVCSNSPHLMQYKRCGLIVVYTFLSRDKVVTSEAVRGTNDSCR